jgi:hypothetical protein
MQLRSLIPLIGTRLIFFIAEILILIACVCYIEVLYDNEILPDKEVKETYTQTTCTLVSKKMLTAGSHINHFRANFLISFMVNGVATQAYATGNGLDQSYSHHQDRQQDILDQFAVGSSYPCWYNPQVPQMAVLVLRHDWMSTLPLAVPAVIALITLYYLLKSILQFFGLIGSKTREIIDPKKHFKG